MFNQPFKNYALAIVQFVLIYILGYRVGQSDFIPLIVTFALAFLGYLVIFNQVISEKALTFFMVLAILARVLLVFSFPNLSDDIYRFIWDGQLIINGENPFDYLPSELIQSEKKIPGITQALYERLNSPEYYTIYPPIAQLVNVIAVSLFPNSWWGSAIVMKLFLLSFEVGNILLLKKLLEAFNLPSKNLLLYALNPLIIVEVVGNLHFEGGMIFFLLLGLYWLVKGKWGIAALAMAGAVASKLLPLLFMPYMIKRLGWKKSIRFFLIMGGALVCFFLPLISGAFLQNFGNSVDLYFRRFEFNGSIYYLWRWVGYQLEGYNLIKTIGPRLAVFVFLVVVITALLEQQKDWKSWPTMALLAITTYLFCGTTIHPWYVSLPLVFCVFTNLRYPVLWSGLIMLTYINYSYPTYQENLWIVLFEYTLVYGFLICELWRQKNLRTVEWSGDLKT